jgi:hypothetical protein
MDDTEIEGKEIDLATLKQGIADMLGCDDCDDLTTFDTGELLFLVTATQAATDLLINELESRGEIDSFEGSPMIPYHADHIVECVLSTRSGRRGWRSLNPDADRRPS